MKTTICFVGIMVFAALTARAQDSPQELTPDEVGCRRTLSRVLIGYSTDAAQCLAECHTEPAGSCGDSLDAQTAACIDQAHGKAEAAVLRECAGFSCPECYGGDGNCPAFTEQQFANAYSFTNAALQMVYCDDSSSSDGLNRAERRCQEGLVSSAAKLSEKFRKCFESCDRAVQNGTISNRASCSATHINSSLMDPATQECIDAARSRFLTSCAGKCEDRPDCYPTDCSNTLGLFELPMYSFDEDVYCYDEAPPVCGDGNLTGDEPCDGSANPSGCTVGSSCDSCFTCTPDCGNAIIDPEEQCDYYAVPQGCAADEYCEYDCTCRPAPACGDGRITLRESCDQSADPTGCPSDYECIGCSYCAPTCGNGTVDPSEECDYNGNPKGCAADQYCDFSCTCQIVPVCGDGQITGYEFCDQNADPTGCPDGLACWQCTECTPPSVCGDGQITGIEVCDVARDPTGCEPYEDCLGCRLCEPRCPNGKIDPGEQCDPFAQPTGCAAGQQCIPGCICL